ncbi:hypothetical protein FRZ67_10205 [Panacibacter ginsenosidivorans]|uniref:Cytochrome c n=1 Tax=Panacibacter ginsenosidivorans TaxID=1813871 RepID=A0A5B8V930_9BACT|nr:hypothetical protein [Panacibacter ginsenosidivorans]QEC67645.1 hypothetical protein FRZ67_10205 [Panacibacter ginsenosidivorans]
MKNITSHVSVLFFVSALVLAACNEQEKRPVTASSNEPASLNTVNTELPDGPGYETFKTNCTSCHSARYIKMQPDFPEQTWTVVVAKMQKNFGAPVADSSAKEIVQYLVAIKGKK